MKRILALLALAAVCVFVATHRGGADTASQSGSPTPSATPIGSAAATESPRASGAVSGASSTPAVDSQAMLDAAIADIGTVRPMHVQFDGSDSVGTLSFDVSTDGAGDLTGTYRRDGNSADVVLTGGVLYMRGAATIQSYTGRGGMDPADSHWYHLPAWAHTGLMGTAATAARISQCILAMRQRDNPTYVAQAPTVIAGVPAVPFARPDPQNAWPWEYAVAAASPQYLVGWQYLPATGDTPATSCTGGVDYVAGPETGATGIYTFTAIGVPGPAIVAPPGAVDLPNGPGE